MCVDRVCEGINRFRESCVPLHRNFDCNLRLLILGFKSNDGIMCLTFGLIEVFDEVLNATFVGILNEELFSFIVDVTCAVIF